jgi:hypothetical protein
MKNNAKAILHALVIDYFAYPLFVILIAFTVLFLSDLTFGLIAAYAFDTNATSVSYYVEKSLCFLFSRQFLAIYHVWGIPLVALQFALFFRYAKQKYPCATSLAALAISQVLLSFITDAIDLWPRIRVQVQRDNVGSLLLTLLLVGFIWSVARWHAKRFGWSRASSEEQDVERRSATILHVGGWRPATVASIYFVGVLSWLYIEISYPNIQLQTAEWSSGNPLSQRAATKARNAGHKVLSHRFGNHHDAFVILGNVGNAESIPYLINALQWQSPPHEDGSVVCTTHHCISRLRELTGEWYGTDYIKWKKWWDETGHKMSPEELAKNVVANKDQFKQYGNGAEQRGEGDGVPPPHR